MSPTSYQTAPPRISILPHAPEAVKFARMDRRAMHIASIETYIAGNPWKNWLFAKVVTSDGVYGIGEASRHYFRKPPSDLTLGESAMQRFRRAELPLAAIAFDRFDRRRRDRPTGLPHSGDPAAFGILAVGNSFLDRLAVRHAARQIGKFD